MKTKSKLNVYVSRKDSEVSNHKDMVSKLITSKEQILANYADVCDGTGQYHIKANPLLTNPCSFERSFHEGDLQDVTSGSFAACEPSNSLDQQLCTGRGQG